MSKKLKYDSNLYRAVEGMLYNYKKLKAQIKNIELDIEERENDYSTLSAVQYDKDSLSKTYKFSSEVENKVIKLDHDNTTEELKYLQAKKRSKEIQIERIDNMLSVLNEDEKKLIEMRYFDNIPYKDIADILCKSDSWLQELRKKIIIQKLIPLMES